MSSDLRTEASIRIDAPAEMVWEALTNADLIKQWFFGVDTETDWLEGSPIVHLGEYQGSPYEDRGTILKIEPPTAARPHPLEPSVRSARQPGGLLWAPSSSSPKPERPTSSGHRGRS